MPSKPPIAARPGVPVAPSAGLKPKNRDSLYGRKWKKLSKLFLMSNPLCLRCRRDGRVSIATIVHHAIPHRGGEMLFWDQSNWEAICQPHHDGEAQAEEASKRRAIGGL